MKNKENLPFGKKNYVFMLAGLFLIVLGFVIMASDSHPQGFGFLGLTLGPIITMIGFIVEIYAIVVKPDPKK